RIPVTVIEPLVVPPVQNSVSGSPTAGRAAAPETSAESASSQTAAESTAAAAPSAAAQCAGQKPKSGIAASAPLFSREIDNKSEHQDEDDQRSDDAGRRIFARTATCLGRDVVADLILERGRNREQHPIDAGLHRAVGIARAHLWTDRVGDDAAGICVR